MYTGLSGRSIVIWIGVDNCSENVFADLEAVRSDTTITMGIVL